MDPRVLSIFTITYKTTSNESTCDVQDCDCDCYEKSCYCDRSGGGGNDDEDNQDVGRCD